MSLFESEFEEHMAVAAATRAALGPAFRRMLDAWLACIPVSYTHLTLPTICSV